MLRIKLSRLLCAMLLVVVSCGVYAKDLKVTVKLMQIDGVRSSENMGDELYFSITEYSSNSTPVLSRVPMFPIHWVSKELPKVKNVILWSGDLKEGESVLLILSLLEQDLPPWNGDDHIGSAQVKLANQNGKLVTKWGQPDFKDQPKVKQADSSVPKFMMYGDNSEYVVIFKTDASAKASAASKTN